MNKKILKRNLICVFVTALAAVMMLTVGVMATTTEENGVAMIDDMNQRFLYYETLQEAIDAASSGDIVTLYKSTTEDIVISTDVTIYLNSGCTLTNKSGDTITVENGATLTIAGDGTVDNVTNQRAAIYNNGTVSLDGGIYTRSNENGSTNTYYTILNHGTMTINSGVTVSNISGFSSMLDNGYYDLSSGNARTGYVSGTNQEHPTLTINGGTFSGGINTIKNDDNGILTINDGTFTNYTQASVQNHNTATINGGTFTADSYYAVLNCGCVSDSDEGILTITGGTFSGAYAVYDESTVDAAEITITGGTFTGTQAAIATSSTSSAAITVSSTNVTLNGETNLVAEVGGVQYTSLDAALEAAAELNYALPVTLLADVEYNSSIDVTPSTFKSGLYLDLNGHTLTLGTGCSINVNGGTLGVSDSTGGGMITNAEDSTGATTVRLIKVYSDASTMSTVTISGGSVVATSGVEDVTAAHHAIDVVANNYSASSFGGATVNISGGTVQGVDVAIAVNGQQPENANITINVTGGTVTAPTDTALYLAGYATTTISGGEVSGATGIYMKAGNLYITGGEINGTQSTYVAPAENRNGATSTGDALAIDTIGGSPYYELGTISISGGELYSVDGSAVAIYSTSSSTDKVVSDISITGGTFHGSGTNGAVYVEDGTVDLDSSKTGNQVGFISGGSFGSDVTPYLATGYQVTWSDANEAYVVGTVTTIIGPFYMNEYYHGMLINGTLTTFLHTVNEDGYCTTCGGYIGVDAGEIVEETVEIEDPVEGTDTVTEDDGEEESSAIETPVDTETETNPTTGMAIAFLPMAMAALAAVVTKK